VRRSSRVVLELDFGASDRGDSCQNNTKDALNAGTGIPSVAAVAITSRQAVCLRELSA
jgi:hypothetical protein